MGWGAVRCSAVGSKPHVHIGHADTHIHIAAPGALHDSWWTGDRHVIDMHGPSDDQATFLNHATHLEHPQL
jgi:hypothetical protein